MQWMLFLRLVGMINTGCADSLIRVSATQHGASGLPPVVWECSRYSSSGGRGTSELRQVRSGTVRLDVSRGNRVCGYETVIDALRKDSSKFRRLRSLRPAFRQAGRAAKRVSVPEHSYARVCGGMKARPALRRSETGCSSGLATTNNTSFLIFTKIPDCLDLYSRVDTTSFLTADFVKGAIARMKAVLSCRRILAWQDNDNLWR